MLPNILYRFCTEDSPKMSFQIVMGNKGGAQLCYDNYLFYRINISMDRSYWICKTRGCGVSIILSNGNTKFVSANGSHNHEDDKATFEKRKFKDRLLKKVLENPKESVRKLYREELSDFTTSFENKSHLPSFTAMEKKCYRMRRSQKNGDEDENLIHSRCQAPTNSTNMRILASASEQPKDALNLTTEKPMISTHRELPTNYAQTNSSPDLLNTGKRTNNSTSLQPVSRCLESAATSSTDFMPSTTRSRKTSQDFPCISASDIQNVAPSLRILKPDEQIIDPLPLQVINTSDLQYVTSGLQPITPLHYNNSGLQSAISSLEHFVSNIGTQPTTIRRNKNGLESAITNTTSTSYLDSFSVGLESAVTSSDFVPFTTSYAISRDQPTISTPSMPSNSTADTLPFLADTTNLQSIKAGLPPVIPELRSNNLSLQTVVSGSDIVVSNEATPSATIGNKIVSESIGTPVLESAIIVKEEIIEIIEDQSNDSVESSFFKPTSNSKDSICPRQNSTVNSMDSSRKILNSRDSSSYMRNGTDDSRDSTYHEQKITKNSRDLTHTVSDVQRFFSSVKNSASPDKCRCNCHSRTFSDSSVDYLTQNISVNNIDRSKPFRDDSEKFGEFLVEKLRNLDCKSRDYVKKACSDLISKAESGQFLNLPEKTSF